MAKELSKLKLGKSAAFVKTHLKQLKQENDTWEADFRALPKPKGQTETHYLGLVVALPRGNPLVCFPLVEYTPNVNDLADLLADAMRRPMTDSAHRPRQILLRGNPRWEELFPHLKQLGIEVSIQNELPNVEGGSARFLSHIWWPPLRLGVSHCLPSRPLEFDFACSAAAPWPPLFFFLVPCPLARAW